LMSLLGGFSLLWQFCLKYAPPLKAQGQLLP
jgi:hypothetical protein